MKIDRKIQMQFLMKLFKTSRREENGRIGIAPVDVFQYGKHYTTEIDVEQGKFYKVNLYFVNGTWRKAYRPIAKNMDNKEAYLMIIANERGNIFRKTRAWELWATFVSPEIYEYILKFGLNGAVEPVDRQKGEKPIWTCPEIEEVLSDKELFESGKAGLSEHLKVLQYFDYYRSNINDSDSLMAATHFNNKELFKKWWESH